MSDRNQWINVRAAHGYDWSPFVRAMAELVIRPEGDGVLVDASAIATSPHSVTHWYLEPGDDGEWHHHPSGTSAPFFELLCNVVLFHIEVEQEAS